MKWLTALADILKMAFAAYKKAKETANNAKIAKRADDKTDRNEDIIDQIRKDHGLKKK